MMRLIFFILFLNLGVLGFGAKNDTITIHYVEKYCCGGICCEHVDIMQLIKMENGQYMAIYFDSIVNQNCTEPIIPNTSKKILEANKINLVLDFIANNTTEKKKKKIIYNGTVILNNKTLYITQDITRSSYRDFRKKLLN